MADTASAPTSSPWRWVERHLDLPYAISATGMAVDASFGNVFVVQDAVIAMLAKEAQNQSEAASASYVATRQPLR